MEMTKEMVKSFNELNDAQTPRDQINVVCKMILIAKRNPTHVYAQTVLELAGKCYSKYCFNMECLDELNVLFRGTGELRNCIKRI